MEKRKLGRLQINGILWLPAHQLSSKKKTQGQLLFYLCLFVFVGNKFTWLKIRMSKRKFLRKSLPPVLIHPILCLLPQIKNHLSWFFMYCIQILSIACGLISPFYCKKGIKLCISSSIPSSSFT